MLTCTECLCTMTGCDGKRIPSFPSFPLTLFHCHSRHPHFEVCVYFIHTHIHTSPHAVGTRSRPQLSARSAESPESGEETELKRGRRRERERPIWPSWILSHTHAFGGATLSAWDSCGIVTSSLVARCCI